MLKRSIKCFHSQTYAHKELIILCQKFDPQKTEEISIKKQGENITFIEVNLKRKIKLGKLRNMAIERSNGNYFCIWDDDDWYHPQRLSIQLKALVENHKEASVLMNILLYHQSNQSAFNSHPGPWAQTLLCTKALFDRGVKYPELNKSEDLHFIHKLFALNCIYPIFQSTLYVYIFHHQNTWNEKHFNKLFLNAQKLSAESTDIITQAVNNDVHTIAEGETLQASIVLNEINYFHHFLKNLKLKY